MPRAGALLRAQPPRRGGDAGEDHALHDVHALPPQMDLTSSSPRWLGEQALTLILDFLPAMPSASL